MIRISTSVLIVGFWLAMTASLVRNHLTPPPAHGGGDALDPSIFAEDWRDIEEWMDIRWRGREAGAAMASVRAMGDGKKGYRLDSRAQLSLGPVSGMGIRYSTAATLNEDFTLDSFSVIFGAPLGEFDARGFVYDGRLYIRFTRAGSGIEHIGYWPLDGPISLMEALRPLAARKIDLEDGAVYRIQAIDPVWFGTAGQALIAVRGKESIEIGGQTYEAVRVETTLAGRKTVIWVDEDRSILRYEMMDGIRLDRGEREAILKRHPQLAAELAIPEFDLLNYTFNPELIDLSQGLPMGSLAGILLDTLAPKP